jgi:hypothetical protein
MSHDIEETHEITEDTTPDYTAVLREKTQPNGDLGAPIPGSVLDSLTLTFYQEYTRAIINGRNQQNVLQLNGVSVGEDGVLLWTMTREDTAILNDALRSEPHVAIFEYTFPGTNGTEYAKHVVRFNVDNLVRVP